MSKGRLMMVVACAVVLFFAFILCFVYDVFGPREMPPGWTLMTDGEVYTIQEPDGFIWKTATWTTKEGARGQAWFSYEFRIETAKQAEREWVSVDE